MLIALHAGSTAAHGHVGSGVAVDSRGELVFVDTIRSRAWRVDRDGGLTVVETGVHTNDVRIMPDGSLEYPTDQAGIFPVVGPDGSSYEINGDQVVRHRPDGSTGVVGGFERPVDVVVDAAGMVYVADHDARRIVTLDGETEVASVPTGRWPWRPTGLAVHGGDVYVLERFGSYFGLSGVVGSLGPVATPWGILGSP